MSYTCGKPKVENQIHVIFQRDGGSSSFNRPCELLSRDPAQMAEDRGFSRDLSPGRHPASSARPAPDVPQTLGKGLWKTGGKHAIATFQQVLQGGVSRFSTSAFDAKRHERRLCRLSPKSPGLMMMKNNLIQFSSFLLSRFSQPKTSNALVWALESKTQTACFPHISARPASRLCYRPSSPAQGKTRVGPRSLSVVPSR